MKNLDKEIKKAVEKLTAGDKIQMELDKKNNCLKIWKLKLNKIEVKEGEKWANTQCFIIAAAYISTAGMITKVLMNYIKW